MKAERKIAVRRRRAAAAERIFEGLGVSPGLALGPAHVVESGQIDVPEYAVAEELVAAEQQRFADALAKSQRQLKKLKAKSETLHGAAAEELGFLLDARLQMLTGSRVVRGVEERIAQQRINAEAAVRAEIAQVAESFAALDDAYLAARADDVREVGDRLIRNLTRTPYQAFSRLPAGSIIIAEELTPADTALMDPALVGGFATAVGGAESHTAIMARSLGLPAVLGTGPLAGAVRTGDPVIVDGSTGRVILHPKPATLEDYERRRGELAEGQRQLAGLKRLPAVTRDGTAIALLANPDLPDEEEQYQALRTLIRGMDGLPVTVRTLDVGGDKLAAALDAHMGGGANPALGLRAIRLSLKVRDLLDTQLAAILRAAALGPVRVLLPMIATVSEVRQVRDAMTIVGRRLKRRGVKLPETPPPLGVMIEVPGA